MRCYDKEHITSWYDDHHCFMMFLQQCNAKLVRWVGVSFRGMSVPVLLEFEFDDRHDRSKTRDYNRPEHFTPSRLPVHESLNLNVFGICFSVDAAEHSYMNVNSLCGCTELHCHARSRQVHLVWSINTPQNVLEASYRSRNTGGPRWTAAEWAAWREQQAQG